MKTWWSYWNKSCRAVLNIELFTILYMVVITKCEEETLTSVWPFIINELSCGTFYYAVQGDSTGVSSTGLKAVTIH